MAITVKHKFVSTIPDGTDTTVVRPSNWNDTHELTGLGTMAEQDANAVAITGGTISGVSVSGYVPTTETITAGTGLTGGGDLSANRTIALANTAVTTGTYGNAARTITQTVDQQGRLTNIFDQPIAIANTQVSGLGTASTKDAGVANGVATLDSAGKVPLSQIPDSLIGALSYQGTWNASTNTPTLTSSVGTKGYYYVVNVAGTTNLNGITDWQVGDWAVYNGTAWQKIDNTDSVTSVNGFTGAVVLTTTNIAEGTNLYYTDARARAAISAGTGLNYNSTSGAMNFSNSSVATWAATPTSANLAAAVTDETGSGSLVFGTGPTLSAPVIDGSNPYIQFNNGSAVTVAAGKLWYDGSTGSWNAGMGGGNITQQIGEELFVYGKASSAITDSPLQIIYQTGSVGASGTIQFAPTVAGITNGDLILGVATESIALNGFGRVTSFGVVHGVTTNGTAYGETWADGDVIWYNPVTGNPTNIKPVAPNIKVQVGVLIKAGSGGSGSIQVEINHGSVLGGTDSNVQLTSVANGNILTYDGADGYWRNTDLTAGTGISVSKSSTGVLTVTNTAPSSGGTVTSVATGTGLTGGPITTTGTISIANTAVSAGSYTYASLTVDAQGRLTAASSGTAPVTSVAATAPVVSSGGTTPTISMAAANTTTNGYLTSTDWNTFNNKQPAGSYLTAVTADAPLSGSGTSASHLVISQANTSTNGYLSSTDWNTFNGKAPAVTYTTNYVPYGQGTTTPALSANFTFNGTNLTVGTAGVSSRIQGDFTNATVNSRTAFQTGTTNGATGIYALPNGTSTAASWQATNAADPTNASKILIATNASTDVQLVSGINGTGTYLPLTFWNNGAEKARLSVAGGFSVGTATDAGSTNILAAGSVTGSTVRASNGIIVNSKTVSASYSIASGDSAMSVGPVTVASGQTVTIASGSRWVVL